MGQAQLKAGQELVAYLKNKYKISTVKRHKDIDNSVCPGKNFPFEQMKNATSATKSKGTEKDRIKALQTALNKDFNCKLAVDGVIGQATTKSVMLYYLKYYTSGNFVKWTQTQLKRKKYDIGKCGIDGGYGRDTEAAVEKYQKANKLTVDGCVGIEVIKSLIK